MGRGILAGTIVGLLAAGLIFSIGHSLLPVVVLESDVEPEGVVPMEAQSAMETAEPEAPVVADESDAPEEAPQEPEDSAMEAGTEMEAEAPVEEAAAAPNVEDEAPEAMGAADVEESDVPEVPVAETAVAEPEPVDMPTVDVETADVAPEVELAPVAPEVDVEEMVAASPEPADEALPEIAEAADEQPEPQVAPDTPVVEEPTDTGVDMAMAEPPAQVVVSEDEAEGPVDTLGARAGTFTERQDSFKSARLPSIGLAPAATPEEAAEAPVVDLSDLPALLAYGADYAGPDASSAMSVILIDTLTYGPSSDALASLPFSVTIAVDALIPGAGDRARAFREAGYEVLALLGLPQGASPQDAAVAIDSARALVPVSIGFLDEATASYQASRQVAAEVVANAQQSGHAVVSYPRGLNSVEQESRRSDLPYALVFREIDGMGQDSESVKRFLDQAAFRAKLDDDIVVVGHTNPETLQGLVEWALGNRAREVSLVPLSYLLTQDAAAETETAEAEGETEAAAEGGQDGAQEGDAQAENETSE